MSVLRKWKIDTEIIGAFCAFNMEKLITYTGKAFEVQFAAPAEYIRPDIFMASIINSDMDYIHNTFKNSHETDVLKVFYDDDIENADIYYGFTKYLGFSISGDAIRVSLQKV